MPDTTNQQPNNSSPNPSKPNVICIDAGRIRFAQKQQAEKQARKPQKEWTRSETLALGQQSCCTCFGMGTRPGRNGKTSVCSCVLRTVFNAVYRKFRFFRMGEATIGRVSYDRSKSHGIKPISTYSRRNEEFAADFILVAFRALNEGKCREQLAAENEKPSLRWTIFTMHFLLGADWRACCGKLGMDRGNFYHEVYRIQAQLGRAFAETEPYALFPLDDYFTPGVRRDRASETGIRLVMSESAGDGARERARSVSMAA